MVSHPNPDYVLTGVLHFSSSYVYFKNSHHIYLAQP